MTLPAARASRAHGGSQAPATLRTVAKLAGVSASTVSRVLNAGPGVGRWASPATTTRIRAIATQVGYVPNPHAASLRTHRSNLIGVLVPRLSDLVLATIYEGIEEAAAAAGYHTFVANSRDRPEEQRACVEMLLSRRADGLILGDAYADARFVDELAAREVPVVLVSRRAGNHPSVTCDDELGGRLAAEHLLSLGHRRVGVIAGEPYASTGIDRTAGFVTTYPAAGFPVPADLVIHSQFDVAGGVAQRSSSWPTTVFRRPSSPSMISPPSARWARSETPERSLAEILPSSATTTYLSPPNSRSPSPPSGPPRTKWDTAPPNS